MQVYILDGYGGVWVGKAAGWWGRLKPGVMPRPRYTVLEPGRSDEADFLR